FYVFPRVKYRSIIPSINPSDVIVIHILPARATAPHKRLKSLDHAPLYLPMRSNGRPSCEAINPSIHVGGYSARYK
ncbi:MAG TPA: hypothetical protein VEC57_07575, partial [Candidatus Limnocylindrales bacterium]|nr:hypothetical protein [Candidatus Limnocylindrales bacterium]